MIFKGFIAKKQASDFSINKTATSFDYFFFNTYKQLINSNTQHSQSKTDDVRNIVKTL